MNFGERLKLLREEKNYTQQDLADLLKVGRPTIAGYETKGKQPDYEKLVLLAEIFNVTIDYLVGRTNIRNFSQPIVALHREDGYEEDLPDEARKEIEEFKKFIRHKYGKK